ncbi:probable galactinol--sucrose galactosyltransferase 2 [Aristolochia californica]|uniref:probable galactinol--sucrose galactosyltransferase 2 n=1 Tax=Aristolochia californica TaxID=171875 RepID=UPI0035E1C3EA
MISSSSVRSLQFNSHFLSPRNGISLSGCPKFRKLYKHSMCLCTAPILKDGILRINGKEALTGVPENVTVTTSVNGSAFLGAIATEKTSRGVFKLGVLEEQRFFCLYRFKIWWMVPRMGKSGSEVPTESQLLILEAVEKLPVDGLTQDVSNKSPFYILFLPLLDGGFRSSLQGNSSNELEFCTESGDPAVVASEFPEAVFISCGDNPFELVKKSMKLLVEHKGTFRHIENKEMPGMLDWFGWCTWDAFYHDVSPQGISDGLTSLNAGGTPPKFLIIDDGWQDTENEFQKEGEPFVEGSQFGGRIVSIKENLKFRENDAAKDLKHFVTKIKDTFGLKYVYVWHALMGYWGGLHPNSPGTQKYNPKLLYPVQSPGNLSHMRDISMDCMEKYGVGVIDPTKIAEFYDDLHSYLASQNVDGVKVDVQNITETVGSYFGGRVPFTKQFHQALEKSIAKNFQDNSIICCMAHSNDSVYNSKQSAVTRASDDYMPRNETSQTLHVAAVSFNSIYLGEVMLPDWDMFYSNHYAAEFHAVARAVGGCGVYISDKPGDHDFEILKRLVLSDGSILRAKYPGRPTRDCLFNDPVMDRKSLLKIWNVNKLSGVIGIFNCQGAGVWPGLETVGTQNSSQSFLTGHVSPTDVEYLEEIAGELWTGDCAVFSFKSGSVSRLSKTQSFDASLKVLECDVFTISPIKVYNQKIEFAPIGLIEMYNSGGAAEAVDVVSHNPGLLLSIRGRGSGLFGAYSSSKPKFCTINSKKIDFEFDHRVNYLKLLIPKGNSSWDISIQWEA